MESTEQTLLYYGITSNLFPMNFCHINNTLIIEGLLRLKARVPHLHVGGNQQVVFLNHTILFRVVGDSDFNIFHGICTHPITQNVLIGIPME